MTEKAVLVYCLSKLILRLPLAGIGCDGVIVMVRVDCELVVVGEAEMATPV